MADALCLFPSHCLSLQPVDDVSESESAVRRNGKGNELGKGERGKKKGVQKPMSLFNQGVRYTYIESGIESESVAAGGWKGMHIVHYSERRGEDG